MLPHACKFLDQMVSKPYHIYGNDTIKIGYDNMLKRFIIMILSITNSIRNNQHLKDHRNNARQKRPTSSLQV